MLRRALWALMLLGGLALAGTVFTAWAPDRAVETLTPRWAEPPSRFIDLNGLQVHLSDEALRDGPLPIGLIDGTSASLHTSEVWMAALKGRAASLASTCRASDSPARTTAATTASLPAPVSCSTYSKR